MHKFEDGLTDSFTFRKEFIECYKKFPVLWDRNHPDYSSALRKEIGYNALMELWEHYNGYGTLMDVKKEINNLRGRYRKELRKIILAEESGRVYKPNMKLFKMLDFLRNNIKCDREELTETEKSFIKTLPTVAEYNDTFSDIELQKTDAFYARCPFPRKLTASFIECFGKQQCLWDVDHPKYRCIMSRSKAINELLKVLCAYCGSDCTIHDVKRKINSIRTSYGRERSKERKCPGYKSKVWWLSLADFLDKPLSKKISDRAMCQQDNYFTDSMLEMVDDSLEMIKSESGETIKIDDQFVEERDANANFGISLIEECKDPFDDSTDYIENKGILNMQPTTSGHGMQLDAMDNSFDQDAQHMSFQNVHEIDQRKRVCFSVEDKMLLNAYQRSPEQGPRDAFDEMAKIWANKLRSMSDIQSIFATKAINEIIFQGELERLTFETVQRISSLPTFESNDESES